MTLNREYIEFCNVKVYCEYLINNKPPLLLIHGFASSTYTFNLLIPLLKKHFSIVAIDLPGFGRSEKSASFVYSLHNYAKIVACCIEHFKFKHVTIVGHSMGGQVALFTAKMIPEKINKLVLLASSGYLKRPNKSLIYCSYLPFFRSFVKRKARRKEVKEYLLDVFYEKSSITADHVEEFGRPLQEDGFYISLIRLLRHREGDLSSDELKKINTPTLLIWGEEDRVVSVKIGHKLVNDLPNAKLITYEKTGHLISEERPTEIYNHIVSHALTQNEK
ncbi:pimeloyl-ACP methyl ester carboxylesterase [Salirhabdus euzebyi]|uniref:Pimeloyl-ACP methyl ester carboxylesterase n=1 Tax=Salirhabdus euzebyi TaxID=394506 RepID=A0A841Q9Q0_9BACI|nr:alpha/beta hydrolase [Salirhabdus euzebyi]MBB6455419.1 pimeloyl-ACP methyl ester carboxylesterase [Salirhabdus euzebyi]